MSIEDTLAKPKLTDITTDLSREERLELRENVEKVRTGALNANAHTDTFAPKNTLKLEIAGFASISVIVDGDMIVGRQDNHTNYTPEVDLSPFGAHRLGISRRHAMLKVLNNTLNLIDLGSRNGTMVNNERLAPDAPRLLRNHDEIMVGTLRFNVVFMSK